MTKSETNAGDNVSPVPDLIENTEDNYDGVLDIEKLGEEELVEDKS